MFRHWTLDAFRNTLKKNVHTVLQMSILHYRRNRFTSIDWSVRSYGSRIHLKFQLNIHLCEWQYFHYRFEWLFTRSKWNFAPRNLKSTFKKYLSRGPQKIILFPAAPFIACRLGFRKLHQRRHFPLTLFARADDLETPAFSLDGCSREQERHEEQASVIPRSRAGAKLSHLWFFWGKRAPYNGSRRGVGVGHGKKALAVVSL